MNFYALGQKSGAYTEGGSDRNRTHPLTTFDRNKGISEHVEQTRTKVINFENHYNKIYNEMFFNALTGLADASRAKDAAFVFLIGIKPNGDTLDEASSAIRSFFKDKYLDIIGGWSDEKEYLLKENQFCRARENILLMQGYDYLVLAEWTGATAKLTSQLVRLQMR
ncbi:MAG: hypothetical protein SGJ00_11855 [bacterium]|nr:hypothetical protein [bacterium]